MWYKRLPASMMELRVHYALQDAQSQPLVYTTRPLRMQRHVDGYTWHRRYMEKHYQLWKEANPTLPILVRPATQALPRMYGRFGKEAQCAG